MFEYLRGTVHFLSDSVAIEIAGIGFKVHVPTTTKDKLTEGKVETIYTFLSVKEDDLQLYGFITPQDRDMFEKLQTVSGIGPSIALTILSKATVNELYQAIYQEDLAFFKRIKGIGAKTASRMVLELKGNLPKIEDKTPEGIQRNNAIKALMGLGYSEYDASEAVKQAEKEPYANLEELVVAALRHLSSSL